MAISFKNVKSTVLDMTDTIRVGKLQGCRICDVIPDHYEYLIWADKSGLMKYTGIVTETIKEHAGFKNQQRHQLEEVDPYTKEYDEPSVQEVNFSDDDVPF
jgi:hypothetical protein